jgi:sugar phosphate isomerase/epimerase
MEDLSRLCIHSITTKPWDIETACAEYARAGVSGITVWRNVFETHSPEEVARLTREHGLEVVSLCRGGFFPSPDAEGREEAIEENRRILDEAAAIGAPMVVLVCGADPAQPLWDSREQIEQGIRALLPDVERTGVALAVEPLHPMYADTRSAVTTLGEATDLCDRIAHPDVGVAVDVYHVWWDPHLETEIDRCAKRERLFAFHVCDWRVPTRRFLTDRELMGRGCIPVRRIRECVEGTGFDGPIEVEIFSEDYWEMDQQAYLQDIVRAYRDAV